MGDAQTEPRRRHALAWRRNEEPWAARGHVQGITIMAWQRDQRQASWTGETGRTQHPSNSSGASGPVWAAMHFVTMWRVGVRGAMGRVGRAVLGFGTKVPDQRHSLGGRDSVAVVGPSQCEFIRANGRETDGRLQSTIHNPQRSAGRSAAAERRLPAAVTPNATSDREPPMVAREPPLPHFGLTAQERSRDRQRRRAAQPQLLLARGVKIFAREPAPESF